MWLRQSTAGQEILLGPFLDSTDGNTAETALTIANTDIKLWKEGATTEANKNSGGATHIAGGRYYAVLDATDSNTLGKLEVNVHVSGALAVRREFMVVPAMIYDSLILGTDRLDTNVTHIGDTAQTANDNGADINAILVDTAEIGAAGAGLTALAQASVCTETRLSELDAATAGKMANQVDIIQTDTTTDIPATLSTIAGYIDTEVAAILTDTGTTIPAQIAALNNLGAADVRAALGLAAANLDTQLADIPTVAEFEARTPTAAQLAYITAHAATAVPVTFTGGTTTTAVLGNVDGSAASSTDDYYNGRVLIFNAGTLNQQVTDITDYVGSTKTATITAVTTAVTSGHTAILV